MGLFNQEDQDVPELGGGFFKRLRAPRAGFVEGTSGAEPKRKRERKEPASASTESHRPAPSAETTSRATNPQVMFLGRALSGGDIEDVESTTIEDTALISTESTPSVPDLAGSRSEDEPAFQPFVPPVFERPTFESLAAAMHSAEQRSSDAPRTEPSLDSSETWMIDVAARAGAATNASVETSPIAPIPTVATGVAAETSSARTAERAAFEHSRRSVDEVAPGPKASKPIVAEDADEDGDSAGTVGLMSGRPELVSPKSLPEFKRILTVSDDDAALRIPANARKEFVAVELQPGIAITVATARFCEKAQYASFIKDLGSNDILVREEMVASEAVIAGIYTGKAVSTNNAGVREASRAIGNFRDIIEAAHAYGASDIHFEPREFHSDVEVRFRVNGDMYTFRHMPKAIVRRALFAAYSDLVQRNTNSGNSFQPTAPQSAMIPLVVKTDTVNLRWQSSPLVGGYDVTLRLLDGNFKNFNVLLPQDMGFEQSQLDLIDTLNYVSGGITALTGETGSGKTTTLRALSYMLPDRELKKQFAVNEPSEYPMPWLSDYSIIRRPDETDDEANRKYAEVIRTLMRQDPDDLTIGEVRDRVVMGLVAELALTGHPVRFSLHASDVIAAVMRMAGARLQLPIDELASEGFINAVGNQKLIATLCDHCKLPAEDVMPAMDLEILRNKFGLDTSRMACRNYDGCQHCRLDGLFTRNGKVAGGTKRPSVAAELYRPTPEFLERVRERDWAGARRIWRGERRTGFDNADMTGKTLYEHALFKSSRGLIDPQFINRSMQSFARYRVMPGVDGRML
ncbi:ATPase, T2SS/T4P/T4SS family [Caballeronia sp. LZ035]|uniref:ATPase, T2SS/T4P/T4SS family n=1 Tax=Caballeronia sp. LZ035 TaxID=3038568 RepID=UPI002866547F|nr:ATPase, T2SS/T4P/T4SS family [Caballeronia sp. LZ035]MDR5763007.1 ATPase, T2SS/T4P/T4SS family [Caballeronia sp. LZ035]